MGIKQWGKDSYSTFYGTTTLPISFNSCHFASASDGINEDNFGNQNFGTTLKGWRFISGNTIKFQFSGNVAEFRYFAIGQ